MNWFNSQTAKKNNNILIVCGINILFSTLYMLSNVVSYSDYQSMMGALNGASFIYMAGFQTIILTGLVLIFFGNKKGFYIYLTGQIISFIYPIVTGTTETVWGLLILPILVAPIVFAVFYYRNLNKLY
jgi:hypothetical protein